ncbi:MAG: hypothetical protein UV44_C0001G0050 [candidate division WWE3 bacterium GW2011_GWD1_42_70]|nr:MAG: hypothetical protein UV44_C0001G0050 [candidate division WWE3 bacterium GW2011_GWD1_42_70]
MKVLITGADGLVATHYLNYTGKLHDFICPDEKELDITDAVLVELGLENQRRRCKKSG